MSNLIELRDTFLKSIDFKNGVIKSTKASWEGNSYSVEFFVDGTWRIDYTSNFGNLYTPPLFKLVLPHLTDDEYEYDDGEIIDPFFGNVEEYFKELFDQYLEEI